MTGEYTPKIIKPSDYADNPAAMQYAPTIVEVHDGTEGKRLADIKAEANRPINRFIKALCSENRNLALEEWAKSLPLFDRVSVLLQFMQNANQVKPDMREIAVKFLLENINKRP